MQFTATDKVSVELIEYAVSHFSYNSMYHLFVSALSSAWQGDPWQMESSRCINEYTDSTLRERFGSFSPSAVVELRRYPCIFAYESSNHLDPVFGRIRDITARQNQVRVSYDIVPVTPFITAEQLSSLLFELDIGRWELNRTHWALKSVSLAKELRTHGIILPDWASIAGGTVDVTTHQFDVALSFPGEARDLVEAIASELERLIGPDTYFYDNNYTAQLARPDLDVLLQGIYRSRSRLIVVFLSNDYQRKEWPRIEFRAIRDIILQRQADRVMFIRTDDGSVEGVFKTDGYVDARRHSPSQLAKFIFERLQHTAQ